MHIKNLNEIDLNRVVKWLNLVVPSQNAKLGPPVGPVLGQAKIKVKDFCTIFNNVSKPFTLDFPLRVSVFVFKNETFGFFIKTPSILFLLKNYLKYISSTELSLVEIYKIAILKQKDLDYLNLQNIFKNILVIAKINNIKIKKK